MQTYFHYDGLGSVTALTNAAGIVTDTYTYDAFGGATHTSGASANYWLFAGEQRDSETGFYYLHARYYDPAIGRFLTPDPVPGAPTVPQTFNRYPYAANDPVNRVDPTGLVSEGGPGLSCLSFVLLLASVSLLLVSPSLVSVALGFALLASAAFIDRERDDEPGLALDLGASGTFTVFQAFQSSLTRRFAGHLIFLDLLYSGGGCLEEFGVGPQA